MFDSFFYKSYNKVQTNDVSEANVCALEIHI